MLAAVSDRRTAVETPPLQNASEAASLPRHGGVKPPLTKRRSPLGPTECRPQGRRYDSAFLSRGRQDATRERPPLPEDERFLDAGRHSPETFEYRLGNRSALEWVIDQYQVTEDKHSGIRSDPNRPDDPEYIVRLVGQVIRVSVETVKLVNSLPAL
jgi:hypothetical protein